MKDNTLREELIAKITACNDKCLQDCLENYLKYEEELTNARVAKAFADGFSKGEEFVTNMLCINKKDDKPS